MKPKGKLITPTPYQRNYGQSWSTCVEKYVQSNPGWATCTPLSLSSSRAPWLPAQLCTQEPEAGSFMKCFPTNILQPESSASPRRKGESPAWSVDQLDSKTTRREILPQSASPFERLAPSGTQDIIPRAANLTAAVPELSHRDRLCS